MDLSSFPTRPSLLSSSSGWRDRLQDASFRGVPFKVEEESAGTGRRVETHEYPTNKLPDLRGEFIRGWDDGRGIDAGRALLSLQAGMLEKHRHIVVANDGYDTKDEWELATIFKKTYTQGRGLDATNTGGSLIPSPTLHSRGSIGNTGGSETRPRNIAFNFIVRAA